MESVPQASPAWSPGRKELLLKGEPPRSDLTRNTTPRWTSMGAGYKLVLCQSHHNFHAGRIVGLSFRMAFFLGQVKGTVRKGPDPRSPVGRHGQDRRLAREEARDGGKIIQGLRVSGGSLKENAIHGNRKMRSEMNLGLKSLTLSFEATTFWLATQIAGGICR